MTDKERAVVMAYTGISMLTGDKFQIFHKYVEDIMGRPVMTHEIGFLADTIVEKSKADFIALCADESEEVTLEQEPRWIPVSERYPQVEDEYKSFLVTDDKGEVSISNFYLSISDRKPYWSGMINVVAWMPLPSPYKAESEVEE